MKAKDLDNQYQERKLKLNLNKVGNRSFSGLTGETQASRKRNEDIKRRIKLINDKSQTLQV